MATAMRGTGDSGQHRRWRYEEFHRVLNQQDGVFRARKRALRESVPAEFSAVKDLEEESVDLVGLGVGLAVLELSSRAIQDIETALRRLRTGVYGTCADCGCRISSARLRALAFADLCRGCQEVQDTATATPATGRGAGWEGVPS